MLDLAGILLIVLLTLCVFALGSLLTWAVFRSTREAERIVLDRMARMLELQRTPPSNRHVLTDEEMALMEMDK